MSRETDARIPDGEPLDTACALLANQTRRRLLYLLQEHGSLAVDDLADILTGWRAASRGSPGATPDDRTGTLLELRHHHLPKMADTDLFDLDTSDGVVTLGSVSPVVQELLDTTLALEPETAEAVATVDFEAG